MLNSGIKLKSSEITHNFRLSSHIKKEFSLRTKEEIKFFDEDNNFIDYFFEVGIKPETFKEEFLYNTSSLEELNKKLIPQIISRFPETNKKTIVINNMNIKQIFPNGFKIIEAKSKPDPDFFAVMTDNQLYSIIYKYKYLSCLVIYESISDYRKLFNKYFNKEENINNDKIKNIYIPKCLCIASVHPCIDKFEEILKAIYETTMSNKYNNLFLNQLIEELVIRTPKIPLGYKNVFLKFNNKIIDLFEKKINEFPLIHTDISRLFGMLNIYSIIEIFKFILFEGNIIFFSTKKYELTNSIMSLLFLLSPFKYQYQVISILPKEYFLYLESDLSFIFGINQAYNEKFFEENNINLKKLVCIVDLDEKKYEYIPKDYNVKDIPEFPKHFKDKIETQIQGYYKSLITSATKNLEQKDNKNNKSNQAIKNNNKNKKNKNKIEDKNEKYQIIFYKFMIDLLEDYSKYLIKEPNNIIDDCDINKMIDINLYINSFNIVDRDFYKRLFRTKMFKEFIQRRINPKDIQEKIEIIFFEEKKKEKIAEKKMFGKSKIKEQNILLSSKEYDYLPEPEIIDLSKLKLSPGVIDLLKDDFFPKINCLNKGYIIEEKIENNNSIFTFNYYIFPSLFDTKFFLLNASFLIPAPNLYKNIELINSKIGRKASIKFKKKPILQKLDLENDLYICYIILFSLTFWYIEEKEREYRFRKMLLIFDKIKQEKTEIFQLLLESLNKYGAREDEIFNIYIIFLNQKIEPNYNIFNLMLPILEKKEMDNKINPTLQFLKLDKQNLQMLTTKLSNLKDSYNKRVLKSNNKWENSIISDDVRFICYTKCIGCGKVIDIGKLCSNLSSLQIQNQNGVDMVKCCHKNKDGKNCEFFNYLRLKFKYGAELYNQKLSKFSTCKDFNIPLISTNSLKERLIEISKYYKDFNEKIDIDTFKQKFQIEFWNSMWYFELNGIDISFILPYLENEKANIHQINNLNNSKAFKNHKVTLVNDNKNIVIERSYFKNKYYKDELCKQIIYQFAFFKYKGMVSYKNIFLCEDNINYNELPLTFENVNIKEDFEDQNDEPTLIRSMTNNNFNNYDNNYNETKSSYIINTPISKKYNNYISILSKNVKKNVTLVNSSSSPSLINNPDLKKNISNSKTNINNIN